MKKILFAALALVVVMASCVKDQIYPGVTISNMSYTPTAVQPDMPVTVTANIAGFSDFTAKLFYTAGEEDTKEVAMISAADSDLYSAVIPGKADGVTVVFFIEVEGAMNAKTATMEYTVGAVAVDYSVLRLNELNGNDKFIEIYNTGAEAINLNGVYIEKDGAQNWAADNTVSIEAGGYLLLYSEDVTADHEGYPESLIFHSGLSAKKNVRIQLFTPAGESIDDFNLVDIDANDPAFIPAPGSYSRNSDGNWYYADATPGEANVDGETAVLGLEGGVTPEPPTPEEPDYTNLVLNELNGDTKFIELFNKGDMDLELNGLYIEKDDKTDPIWIGDGTLTVPAHGYIVFYSEDVVADHPEIEGTNYVFFSGLSGKKVIRIALFMSDGTALDEFIRGEGEWGATISNVAPKSYARTPDGGDWKLADPTPGEANPAEGEDIPQE